jgi:hypothetical protein
MFAPAGRVHANSPRARANPHARCPSHMRPTTYHRADWSGFQSGTLGPIREMVRKPEFFRQNNRYSFRRPRRKLHVCLEGAVGIPPPSWRLRCRLEAGVTTQIRTMPPRALNRPGAVLVRAYRRHPGGSGAGWKPALRLKDNTASSFEPARSGFRFHSGPRVNPLLPAFDAWREIKPGGA